MTIPKRDEVRLLGRLRRIRVQLDKLPAERDELLREGRQLGIASGKLAEAAGVSDGRVRQLAPGRDTHQGETVAAPETLAAPAGPTIYDGITMACEGVRTHGLCAGCRCVCHSGAPRLAPDAPLLSAHSSTTTRQPWSDRVTAFVELEHKRGKDESGHVFVLEGTSPAHLLAAVPDTVQRVFLCQSLPQGTGSSRAERVRSWGLLDAGPGWSVAEAGHFTADADAPVFRWTHVDGRTVEVLTAFGWFGDADAIECWRAWAVLGAKVRATFKGGTLLSTPATTGRDLWRRTIPAGKSYEVMSTELRELIRATSGQGRAELLPPRRAGVDAFTYLDGRFMYAALTWGLPVGEPTRWTRAELVGFVGVARDDLLAKRGRWLVTATVPDGWAHVGILPAQREGGGWRYPSAPGERFTSWVDACEAQLAARHGWELELHEGFTWAEGKPLNVWTSKLVELWEQLRLTGHEVAARGVRAMLLFGIGAFAGSSHMVTRSAPLDRDDLVPPNARVRIVGDTLVWEQPAELSSWAESMAHPEWSAQIWARARVRLLDAPGADGQRVGALHVPRDAVVAFRTDALYLDGDPGWADDGKVGRFRVKGQLTEGVPWPRTNGELFSMRDAAERGDA